MDYTTGPEAVEIIRRHGLWPEYELEKVRGEQRVAEVKAGKGVNIAVADLAGGEGLLRERALEFARAKAAVQLKVRNRKTASASRTHGVGAGPALATGTRRRERRRRPGAMPPPDGRGCGPAGRMLMAESQRAMW